MGDCPFRNSFIATAIFAFALLSIPSVAAAKQQQSAQPNRPKKVWTNADLEQLRDRDAISIVGVGLEDEVPAEPTPAAQGAKQKVWTNDDLEKLRDISIVPTAQQAPTQPAAPAATAPPAAPAPTAAARYNRYSDSYWYAEMEEQLRVQLDEREYALLRYEEGIALAQDRMTQPGIDLSRGDVGITPEAGVQNLETSVGEVLLQIDDLRNLARRNDIPPGALRD